MPALHWSHTSSTCDYGRPVLESCYARADMPHQWVQLSDMGMGVGKIKLLACLIGVLDLHA